MTDMNREGEHHCNSINEMSMNRIKVYALILFLFFAIIFSAHAVFADSWDYKVICGGNWVVNLNRSNLTAGSVFELVDGLESDPDEVKLTIKTNVSNPDWKVTVERSDENWPEGLELKIRRTDIKMEYISVGADGAEFFTGQADKLNNLPIQFKLEGLDSIFASLVSNNTKFKTEIRYTITENI